MTVPPTAYVVHAMPGRVRLRVPDRRGDAAFFDAIVNRVAELPAVTAVAANAQTGSILVHFTGTIEALAASAVRLLDAVRLELSPPPVQPMLQRVRTELAAVDTAIHRLTGGEADAGSLFFFGLVAVSALQLLRGNILTPAATSLWYAAELARRWRPAGPAEPGSGAS